MPIDSQFGLQLAKGRINDTTPLFKFGENTNVDTAFNTIWDAQDTSKLYPYLTSAQTIHVCPQNATDDPTIRVFGLDADYNVVIQDATIVSDGVTATPVSLATPLIRVYRAFRVGSSGTMDADILIGTNPTGSTPQTTVAKVSAEHNQTMMCVYTVPAGHTLYVYDVDCSSGTETGGRYVEGRIVKKLYGESAFRTMASFTMKDQTHSVSFGVPQVLPEKTDIEVRARSSSSSNFVTAHIVALLVKT